MKAMNEFESVLVIASLILAVCAVMDGPLAAPNAGAGRQGSDYVAAGVRQAFDLARQDPIDIAGSNAAREAAPVASLETDHSGGRAPRQDAVSW
ncbi:MAG: hypothetical protein M0P95_13200 [Sulfuritalea sp.]|jgi:hypothetical protein|nr:hypothetical protein [Sulfuritalea sp.]